MDAGKVLPAYKSQAEPEKSADDVKVVVASTMQKEVFTTDRDVLLEVYAPWCGHCSSTPPYTMLHLLLRAAIDFPIYASVFRVKLPPHGMLPPDPGPGHTVPPLGYARLLAFHICLYSLT